MAQLSFYGGGVFWVDLAFEFLPGTHLKFKVDYDRWLEFLSCSFGSRANY